MPSNQQNMHVFADGLKNMNDIFNNHVCSASHMRPGLHFQNVWREPCFAYSAIHGEWMHTPKIMICFIANILNL